MKRVLSIQDISCVGKCSLTVALPILSAAGLETAILPTAVLSTHTAFHNFTFRDLTDDIEPITKHWKDEKIEFDGIETGYLGSFKQIELVEKIFTDFNQPGQLHFVDPAMGDDGKLYPGFTPEFATRMGKLCGHADIIVPNLTEAAFMLGKEYRDAEYDEKYIRMLLKSLCGLGCRKAVITGVTFKKNSYGVAAYDRVLDEYSMYFNEYLPMSFHGTGDIFSAAMFAALMHEQSLQCALKTAVEFTLEAIKKTISQPMHNWYGVDFEAAIPKLLELLKIK